MDYGIKDKNVKKKDLGNITRTKTREGSFDDGDPAKTSGKDGVQKGVVGDKWTAIVDAGKKGKGGEVQPGLLKKNKVGIPE